MNSPAPADGVGGDGGVAGAGEDGGATGDWNICVKAPGSDEGAEMGDGAGLAGGVAGGGLTGD